MATLPKRLQMQGASTHQSQQSLFLCGNKKPEFSSSLVGPRAFIVLFSNRLSQEQGK